MDISSSEDKLPSHQNECNSFSSAKPGWSIFPTMIALTPQGSVELEIPNYTLTTPLGHEFPIFPYLACRCYMIWILIPCIAPRFYRKGCVWVWLMSLCPGVKSTTGLLRRFWCHKGTNTHEIVNKVCRGPMSPVRLCFQAPIPTLMILPLLFTLLFLRCGLLWWQRMNCEGLWK